MITEQPNFDLTLLSEHFTECGDYDKGVILEELRYWQKHPDFLCLVSTNDNVIDGFLIGYRNRNSLWISQVWRKAGTDLETSRRAIEMAKEWSRDRGMTSLTGETKRNEMKAMERYGFSEFSIFIRCDLCL